MAEWKRTLDLKELWKKAVEGGAEFEYLKPIAEEIIKYLRQERGATASVIADDFQSFIDMEGDSDDFDVIMDNLYSWADKNLVWVSTTV